MKRFFGILLLIVFLTSPLAAAELSGTLKQLNETGVIRIGYRESLPPMSFLDKENKPVGYSIDIGKAIVSAVEEKIGLKLKVEYVPVNSETRFTALAENKIDILCGATTKTISRGELVDFTQLTFVTGASFISLRGKNIRNNFAGKKIGVVKETTTISELKKLFKDTRTEAEIVQIPSSAVGIKALDEGKIDAFAADQVVLIGMAIESGKPGKYTIFSDLFSYEPFALAVRKNDSDFRNIADGVIAELYRTKKIHALYDKWFGKFSIRRSSAFEALIMINAIPE